MPDSLAIPIDVTIDKARIGRLEWRSGDSEGTLEELGLSYAGDRRTHRIENFDVTGPGGRLAGSASIGTPKPFATRAALTLDLIKPDPEGRVHAQLDGNFDTLA